MNAKSMDISCFNRCIFSRQRENVFWKYFLNYPFQFEVFCGFICSSWDLYNIYPTNMHVFERVVQEVKHFRFWMNYHLLWINGQKRVYFEHFWKWTIDICKFLCWAKLLTIERYSWNSNYINAERKRILKRNYIH